MQILALHFKLACDVMGPAPKCPICMLMAVMAVSVFKKLGMYHANRATPDSLILGVSAGSHAVTVKCKDSNLFYYDEKQVPCT